MSHNNLTDISADLSDLVMLEVLDLSNNQLDSLPGGVGFMSRLTELSIQHNKIQSLPSDITNLRSKINKKLQNAKEKRWMKIIVWEIVNLPEGGGLERKKCNP